MEINLQSTLDYSFPRSVYVKTKLNFTLLKGYFENRLKCIFDPKYGAEEPSLGTSTLNLTLEKSVPYYLTI